MSACVTCKVLGLMTPVKVSGALHCLLCLCAKFTKPDNRRILVVIITMLLSVVRDGQRQQRKDSTSDSRLNQTNPALTSKEEKRM